ncbi:hypothetical protein [Sphingomonas sp.]|uniref:hypothetical protein n=1 Tax=Sphingomonas sp. TaxID=28214 RepID=UPI001EB40F10|nr:hypothetical protein [Sphingomonas sp.]MBX3593301.1 hypothetical protein [Sphingomonas sp.]
MPTLALTLRTLPDRLRQRFGPRAVAITLAILVELLFALVILGLAPSIVKPKEPVPMAVFGVTPEPEAPADTRQPATRAAKAPQPVARAVPPPAQLARPTVERPPAPVPPPPVLLNMPLGSMPDIANIPRAAGPPAPPRRTAGPPDLGTLPGDSQRVEGRGPHGEPLYAATWFREPYDSELRGYLSTAQGPGWGMIACRTIPNYRVDSCVPVAEYPDGSNIMRAALAAAWQFRVRPPRLGGQYQVGEWVRIRIEYELRREREN